jgi:thiamine-phosphate pyrophosphorylase
MNTVTAIPVEPVWRVIDASINRVSEGLRVLEDICRFQFNHKENSAILRQLRHRVRKSLPPEKVRLIAARDSENDPGPAVSRSSGIDFKNSLEDLIAANFKRVQEGLRSIEEHLKMTELATCSKLYETLRFETYQLEKNLTLSQAWIVAKGIYGITSSAHSRGRSVSEVAEAMIAGGVRVIQYREKHKTMHEKYEECRILRQITRLTGVQLIINDHPELALITGADGVHLGQDDLPLEAVRRILPDKIIGISTHSPEQALKAVNDGADYIGVGPVFSTRTKENVCSPVGLEYLDFARENIRIPFVAIGGIKEHHMEMLAAKQVERIALVTEIVEADDIRLKTAALTRYMTRRDS